MLLQVLASSSSGVLSFSGEFSLVKQCVLIAQLCLTATHGWQLSSSSVHGIFSRQESWSRLSFVYQGNSQLFDLFEAGQTGAVQSFNWGLSVQLPWGDVNQWLHTWWYWRLAPLLQSGNNNLVQLVLQVSPEDFILQPQTTLLLGFSLWFKLLLSLSFSWSAPE